MYRDTDGDINVYRQYLLFNDLRLYLLFCLYSIVFVSITTPSIMPLWINIRVWNRVNFAKMFKFLETMSEYYS